MEDKICIGMMIVGIISMVSMIYSLCKESAIRDKKNEEWVEKWLKEHDNDGRKTKR